MLAWLNVYLMATSLYKRWKQGSDNLWCSGNSHQIFTSSTTTHFEFILPIGGKISKLLASLTGVSNKDGSTSSHALQPIKICLSSLLHAQTNLEACKKPTIVRILSMIVEIMSNFLDLATGMADLTTFDLPHTFTKLLAFVTIHCLNQIYCHDLWCAEMFINLGYSFFHSMPKQKASEYRTRTVTTISKTLSH